MEQLARPIQRVAFLAMGPNEYWGMKYLPPVCLFVYLLAPSSCREKSSYYACRIYYSDVGEQTCSIYTKLETSYVLTLEETREVLLISNIYGNNVASDRLHKERIQFNIQKKN